LDFERPPAAPAKAVAPLDAYSGLHLGYGVLPQSRFTLRVQ